MDTLNVEPSRVEQGGKDTSNVEPCRVSIYWILVLERQYFCIYFLEFVVCQHFMFVIVCLCKHESWEDLLCK